MKFLGLPNFAVTETSIGHGYTWGDAAIVAVCGFAIVFLMLVLLIVIIKIFGFIMDNANKSNGTSNGGGAATAAQTAVKPMQSVAAVDNDEIIAVISAAVYSLYEGTGIKPTIRNIRQSGAKSARSPWATAGIFNNTRAF